MSHAIINSVSGPIKICTVFDFINEVPKHMESGAYEVLAIAYKKFYKNQSYCYNPNSKDILGFANVEFILQTNPMKLLTELKRTTTKKYRTSIDLQQMVHELSSESASEFGRPTHLFSIGHNKYALISVDDVRLVTTGDLKQQLICLRPERNFTIYSPNLRFT